MSPPTAKEKFPTISDSNVKGYEASYKVCGTLYNKVFKEMKLADLQFVVDTCGKNYPTLKKLKSLLLPSEAITIHHTII